MTCIVQDKIHSCASRTNN